MSQALPWVQCEELVYQVLALLRDFTVLICRPGEIAVQDVVKDLLQVRREGGSSAEQAAQNWLQSCAAQPTQASNSHSCNGVPCTCIAAYRPVAHLPSSTEHHPASLQL